MTKQENTQTKAASLRNTKKKSETPKTDITSDRSEFAFDKNNYKWLLICLAFLLIGFLLMIGGGSDDPDVFNYGMFDFQRLTLSPILLFIGYIIGIYAIMRKPKSQPDEAN
jgi:hypothetical protein